MEEEESDRDMYLENAMAEATFSESTIVGLLVPAELPRRRT